MFRSRRTLSPEGRVSPITRFGHWPGPLPATASALPVDLPLSRRALPRPEAPRSPALPPHPLTHLHRNRHKHTHTATAPSHAPSHRSFTPLLTPLPPPRQAQLAYAIEELRLDAVRMLLDVRTLLFYAHSFVSLELFSRALWSIFDHRLGASGLYSPCTLADVPLLCQLTAVMKLGAEVLLMPLRIFLGVSLDGLWALNINPVALVWGCKLPAAAVCFTAGIAHIEPVVFTWMLHWTGRYLRPSAELLEHGFEAMRLYGYLFLLVPLCVGCFLWALLPQHLAEWILTDDAASYLPTTALAVDLAHRLAMALDATLIAYSLMCFRTTRQRAARAAALVLAALLGPVLSVQSCPSFGTTHRAVLLAAAPPFAALLATLLPTFRSARPTPPPPPPLTTVGQVGWGADADAIDHAFGEPPRPMAAGGADADADEAMYDHDSSEYESDWSM